MNKKFKIAIVDDNLVYMNNVKLFLDEEFGEDIEIFFFQNFNQLKKADELSDFYIIDYNLEDDVNGVDVIKSLKEKGFDGTVIVVTGEDTALLSGRLKMMFGKCELLQKSDIYLYKKIIKLIEEQI